MNFHRIQSLKVLWGHNLHGMEGKRVMAPYRMAGLFPDITFRRSTRAGAGAVAGQRGRSRDVWPPEDVRRPANVPVRRTRNMTEVRGPPPPVIKYDRKVAALAGGGGGDDILLLEKQSPGQGAGAGGRW